MAIKTLNPLFAGGSILVALGALAADPLWLALVPAALFLIPTVRGLRASHAGELPVLGTLGALVLEMSTAALLVLVLVGILVELRLGIEPSWVSVLVMWSGIAFLGGAFFFGMGIFKARVLTRPAAALFALSLPLGFALDWATGLVPGFFLSGAGFYLGMGIFALSLIRIGVADSGRRIRP